MPLSLAQAGETLSVRHVGGKPETKKHLENLGFVAGSTVQVVSVSSGNFIVIVKECRIAVSRELAQKIEVA